MNLNISKIRFLAQGNDWGFIMKLKFICAIVIEISVIPFAKAQNLYQCEGSEFQYWNNCIGELKNPKGLIYSGEWKDGQATGHGKIKWPDGSYYFGEVVNGVRNGKGTLVYPNKDVYEGEWEQAKLNGHGTMRLADGTKYSGEWRNGDYNGYGKQESPGGESYEGQWKDGVANGQGIYHFRDGSIYQGGVEQGQRTGYGTFTLQSGEKYVGYWLKDKRHGMGTLYSSSGTVLSKGLWNNSEFISAENTDEKVYLEKEGGVYRIPVMFNDVITLGAIIDSGSADVSIPADIVSTLIRTKTISQEDFLGKQNYILADGSEVPSARFRIRKLKVGNKIVENISASIASEKADILLGQSFLEKFKSWSFDNVEHVLILKD